MRPSPDQIAQARRILGDNDLEHRVFHEAELNAIRVLLAATAPPTMAERERMIIDASTPEQRNPLQKHRFDLWRGGFLAAMASVFGFPNMEDG